ncbi:MULTISPECIES: alpha/beta fold hydrolase [unclassified Arthrobacter]|uniref:alpha/beta fold hydrolase n=1 Tax=unclassified Arthrobacter TaxID=235627 RepID=UPI001490B518|nr:MULTISPECIES: alpha/beta hydrolase [unclassified Arthrobacter]MBE0009504.1 alpha/beta hydrolase [Arthrobacter sp. AET 35A]NOJ63448.1 alpha/beta hydrolase [Arthrobacter sp. 147(2020)]
MTSAPVTHLLARPAQGRIAYDVQGSGPLLLLVPGMGDLRSTYRFISPALVAAGYTVVTTDLRGHGDSNTAFESYGDNETASDIEALIRERGVPATIVGNSMAAGAAVLVAAQHPGLVSRLVLIGPFVREAAISRVGKRFFRLLMARPWAAAAWKAYLPTLYAGRKPVDFAEYRQRVVESLKRPGYARAFSLTTRTDHVDAGNSVGSVTAPTLVVMGEKDPDFKDPKAEADWVSQALNGATVMVPEAGHYPQSQQPELTAAAILQFLDAPAGAGQP